MKSFDLKKELIKKHIVGQKKYGSFSFFDDSKDMDLETIDELIDAINYQVYKIIKKSFKKDLMEQEGKEFLNTVYKSLVNRVVEGKIGITESETILILVKLINKLKK